MNPVFTAAGESDRLINLLVSYIIQLPLNGLGTYDRDALTLISGCGFDMDCGVHNALTSFVSVPSSYLEHSYP